MTKPLEALALQCIFIVREGENTRKLTLPSHWQSALCTTDEEVWNRIQASGATGQRRILIISEEDFDRETKLLQVRGAVEWASRLGLIVISKDPGSFLKSGKDCPQLLDVLPEKDLKKHIGFYLLRALRHLVRAEERSNTRFNQQTLEKLNAILITLSAERDPQRLLATILLKAIDLTICESGSLFMVEESDGDLNFRMVITADREMEVFIKPLQTKVAENSICGYVALTGKPSNIPNVEELRPLGLPQLAKGLDHYRENRTRSMMTIPLKNTRGEIIACLQMTNKKLENESIPPGEPSPIGSFESEDESLLTSFATQAAICLENVDLYADIQRLFEGFVKASITAIESRDPSTGGHSERVAKLCVGLARATTECEVGIYRSVKFKEEEIRELEYAALLHDFGKIGVREEILVKAKKLYAWQLDAIKERIKICKAAAKIAYLERQLKSNLSQSAAEKEYLQKIQQIENYWQIILTANEPTVLKRENMEALDRLRSEQLLLPDGSNIALLTEEEYKALAVTKGSLTESERLEIESHVRHTYQFLKMIPWTKDFKHLPEIAYGHHEKLDGTGYPRGLTSHEIPLQSKIMTIADIFDALTAADRWYKEAVPTERALDILALEVAQGKLDPVLFELFVEKKIFEVTQAKILTRVA